MKENNSMIRLGLILFAITFVVALALSALNAVTVPIIEERQKIELQNAIKAIFPDATEIVTEDIAEEESITSAAYIAKNDEGTLGVAIKTAPSGFGGPINMIVGFDIEQKVVNIQVLDLSETPGLGTKLKEDKFITQYNGVAAPFKVVKGATSAEGDISAISGATISSDAVTTGINAASEVAVGYLTQE